MRLGHNAALEQQHPVHIFTLKIVHVLKIILMLLDTNHHPVVSASDRTAEQVEVIRTFLSLHRCYLQTLRVKM